MLITSKEGRSEALELLKKTNLSLPKIAAAADVPKSTVGELKELLRKKDRVGIERHVNYSRIGKQTVLAEEDYRTNYVCGITGLFYR